LAFFRLCKNFLSQSCHTVAIGSKSISAYIRLTIKNHKKN
jgi:hypothetical protein